MLFFQAYDLQYKRCTDDVNTDFNYTKIEVNSGGQVDITSTITYFTKCKEPYVLKQLVNLNGDETDSDYDYGTETEIHPEFLTWLKPDDITGEKHWRLVDIRGRRDSRKAQYTDFCVDGYFGFGVHKGSVAFFCELPEDLYCKENDCFQHCCAAQDFYDLDKGICDRVPNNLLGDWENEFNGNLPHNNLNFENVTNFYGQDPDNVGISCDEGDEPIDEYFSESSIKYLSNGKVDVDGALIPFGKHCYNYAGKKIKNSTSLPRKYMLHKWFYGVLRHKIAWA